VTVDKNDPFSVGRQVPQFVLGDRSHVFRWSGLLPPEQLSARRACPASDTRSRVPGMCRITPPRPASRALAHHNRPAGPSLGRNPLSDLEPQLVDAEQIDAAPERSSTELLRHGMPCGTEVRIGLSVTAADALADRLIDKSHRESHERLLDQLWLRTMLIEQRRRVRLSERPAFDRRADKLLAALDPDATPDLLTRLLDGNRRGAPQRDMSGAEDQSAS
jgi:hypothetical protein